MKITFKDVGQGDGIVIEWVDDSGIEKIGLIDCNMRGKENPVLEHIKSTKGKYKRIEFAILSHPHEDHYSGFLQLFNYLEETNIPIARFGQTIFFKGAELYWKYFEVGSKATKLITAIQKKWLELNSQNKKLILRIEDLVANVTLRIDEHVSITCMAPSHDDFLDYQKRVKFDEINKEKEASQAANLLSTFLKLSYKEYNFLFTSDTETVSSNRSLKHDPHHLEGVKFHLCQMAHHGSSRNYDPEFWNKIDTFLIQNAVASAGNGYKHPSFKVLEGFHKNGYKVYCTNIVNGMKDFVSMLHKNSKALDTFSEIAEEYTKPNNRIFEIVGGNIELV